jgi:hypothetical protein
MNKIVFVFFAIIVSSCATIFSPAIRNVGINSHPQKANIKVENQLGELIYEGKTPVILPLKSSFSSFTPAQYRISFSKDSFQSQNFVLKAKFNWVSLFFPPGLLVDGITGNMYIIKNVYILEDLKLEPPVVKYDDLPAYTPSRTK